MLKECLENEKGLAFVKVHGPCPVSHCPGTTTDNKQRSSQKIFCINLIILK